VYEEGGEDMDLARKPADAKTKALIEKLENEMAAKLKAYGFDRFAYFATTKEDINIPLIISNYPDEWLEKYISGKLHRIDPVIAYGLKSISPFYWSEIKENISNCDDGSVFEESKEYDIEEGCTFTIHDAHGNFGSLSLCSAQENIRIIAERHKAVIQMALIEMHAALTENLTLNSTAREAMRTKVSVREKEILQWAGKGKTYSEIAVITGITERTVKFHMSNIVKKLEVNNAKHAILMAKELTLLGTTP
jgi:LuxR family quorum-sensing system transcriptional regulator ExpR